MERCAVCNDQEKTDEDDARLTFDVTPAVLSHSAFVDRCESCLVILEGFRQGGQTLYQKDFQRLARTITARCCAQQNGRADTLVLETYFYDDRPKLELELYSLQPHCTKRGIRWDDLPKTFQDAIRMTSLLDIDFIWIDSLCIIQNDKDDWATESAKMADIYEYASLTLSATASAGDSYGCFSASFSTSRSLPISLPEDVGTCELAVRKPITHWNTIGQSEMHARFPLMSRGWAFQERLLSRRVLHFSEEELVWECRELTTCECGGIGEQTSPAGAFHEATRISEDERQDVAGSRRQVEEDLSIRQFQEEQVDKLWISKKYGLRRRSARSNDWLLEPSESNPVLPPYQESDPWNDTSQMRECANYVFDFHRIVERYSTLNLTKRSDRLPALSGLCKRIQHIRGEYAAGLWIESIAFDLLWRVERLNVTSKTAVQPDEDYCGPSWSWVSADDPVAYWRNIINFHDPSRLFRPASTGEADTLQTKPFSRPKCLGRSLQTDSVLVKVAEKGMNPFGRVAYAVLKGSASTTTANLRYTYTSSWHDGTYALDTSRYKLTLGGEGIIELQFWADYVLAAEGARHIPNGTELTLLLVHPRVCLVLVDTGQGFSSVPQYRRVGITRISDDMVDRYRIDWMEFSEVAAFSIV
ncbi:heterokaryon incompatibility protein-domain-containing protein [Boeremia exigua]|uniref:heterokaryon incompatibility protein-domain-containing protein n=1 Tax=Boeremia exigua TaxID=749465 RepID=UPI001E8E43AB|nr:heterokaryon incompatibility protein-domain-containing protein [Boeremia exigua]KAH6639048.1 heterokaryon incompatibility protein-domain-containing protein [Boeremia exigua]